MIQCTGQFTVKGILTAGIHQNYFSGACSPSQALNIHHKKIQSISKKAVQRQIFTAAHSCALTASTTLCVNIWHLSQNMKMNFQQAPLLLNINHIRDVNVSHVPQFYETVVHQQRQPEMTPRRKVWHRSFDSLLPLQPPFPPWQLNWLSQYKNIF